MAYHSGSQNSCRVLQKSDISIETTDEEVKYRRNLFPEPKSVLKTKVCCTACGTSLLKQLNKGKDLFFHPILQVLVCEDCRSFYGDGNFLLDDDNSDTYCRWCAQGGSLYCCSGCNFVFCKPCVRRNFKKSMLEEIEEEDWKCFVCNPESLWKHRAICWAARNHIKDNSREDDDDEEETDSSNDERRRERRRAARENKWRKKGRGRVQNNESSKKSKSVTRPSRITRKIEDSDEDGIECDTSKRPEREKGDVNKKKRVEDLDESKKNKRKEKHESEETSSNDDDNDKRHKHKKLKERDKQENRKKIKPSIPSPPQSNANAEGNDTSVAGEICKTVELSGIDEDEQQIAVMQKTCLLMQKLSRDLQLFTHSYSKKASQLHIWLSDKNKVSHKQLPTTPVKLTKMIVCFKKILQKLGAHTEELQGKVLEAAKEWMKIVEGNEETEAEVGGDGDQEKEEEVSVSKLDHQAKRSSLDMADDAEMVDGNTSFPEDVSVGGENVMTNGVTAANESSDTIEDNERSLAKEDMGGIKANCKSDDKSGENIEKNSGDMKNSSCQEVSSPPKPKSKPCESVEDSCSKEEDKKESRTEGDIYNDGEERMSVEGENSDVEGHIEEERTSEAIDENGKSSRRSSVGDVEENNVLLQDSTIEEAENGITKSKEVDEVEKSTQDLFDSDKEDNNISVNKIIARLDKQLNSKEGSDEIGNDTVVDEENTQRTSVDVPKEESVNDEKQENDSGDNERTVQKIKPSSDDRNAKMSFLLDTSSSSCDVSDIERSSKNKRLHEDKMTNTIESDSELESDDSSKENKVKKTKNSKGKTSIASLLSQQNDAKLKAGCFVSLERTRTHNYKIVDLGIKKKQGNRVGKAISRLGNLTNLDKPKSKADISESESDDGESKVKPKTFKKKLKSKEGEEKAQKDSSGNENNVSDSNNEEIDGTSKIGLKSDEKMLNDLAAELLANSSSIDTSSSESEPTKKKTEKKTKDKTENKEKKAKNVKEEGKGKNDESESSDSEICSKRSWRRDRLLIEKLSETDSSEEERKWKSKKEKEKALLSDTEDSDWKTPKARKKVQRCVQDSDSDILELSSSGNNSDSSDFQRTKKKRKRKPCSSSSSDKSSGSKVKKKKKLRRIKQPDSDSDNNGKNEAEEKKKEDEEEEKEQSSKGRKNIQKIIKGKQLAMETIAATKDEEERIKRISERQKMYNDIFTDKQNLESLEEVVLDFDLDTKKPLVSVDPTLVKKLKPHQAEGVKFMWEACFESLKRIEESAGSGCILAHCMGLGKTLQVITLVHTLLANPKTNVKTVLVICPLNTVLNWVNEFQFWLKDLGSGDDIDVYELSRYKANVERMYQLKDWQNDGGVMILGYEMYRNLSTSTGKKARQKQTRFEKVFKSTLVDPGPDLVICDEGHLLKNIASALSKAVNSIKTARRIVLTGTPLQNNLKEYHCMIQFVKPSLLGTTKEFMNRFVNPITNGQLAESTPHDVRVMKRRAHVLHKMLEGCVQRRDYLVLTPFLPPKYEYVIGIQLNELQSKLYIHYLENYTQRGGGPTRLFNDFQNLQRIWTHPRLLKIKAETDEKKKLLETDSEGSLKDFIDDEETTDVSTFESSDSEKKKNSSSSGSSSESDVVCLSDGDKEKSKENRGDNKKEDEEEPLNPKEWWENYIVPEDHDKLEHSGKLVLLFDILKKCELIGDKVLVFSQSLTSLDIIEHFLEIIDENTQQIEPQTVEDSEKSDITPAYVGSWSKGIDYFRIDGSVSPENRSIWCKQFNKLDNLRARLFLISTRAGGMGINLVGANRVILFDASWNPSNDLQSIFRIYRFGQTKPCYVYRFLAQGTMEEKIYNRQVTKLSLALRVIDEQQIERHFNLNDLQELYMYEPNVKTKRPTPILPKDRLLAELVQKHPDLIDNYHEHDSLLENKTEEELNEEERKAAWEDFENDKKGKLPEVNLQIGGDNAFSGMLSQMAFRNDLYGGNEIALRQAILARHPTATEEQIATEMSLAASRIRQYFTNASYPQMQQFYNAPAQQIHNRPTMDIYSGQGASYSQQMPLLQAQYNLQNYYHNPVMPLSVTNHSSMMPHVIGNTSQHKPQGVTIHQLQPQSTQAGILPLENGTGSELSAPKLKIRNDLMPSTVNTGEDNDIIVESVTRREN